MEFEQWLSGVGKLDFPQPEDFSGLGYKGSFDLRPGRSLTSKEHWKERLEIQKPGVKLEVSDEYPAEIRDILESFHSRQFIVRKGCKKIAGAGAVDLYSGVAGVARFLVRGGCPWVLTFEILRHSSENLLDGVLQQKLLVLIRSDYVRLVGSAIVCKSLFSVAVTPPVRTLQFLRGVPWMAAAMKDKVKDGNAMSDYQLSVHEACYETDTRFWTENPDGSFLGSKEDMKRTSLGDSSPKWRSGIIASSRQGR